MQTKLDHRMLVALLSTLVAAPLQAQPMSDEAAVQLLQRVNELEMELRHMRGENETLQNEIETLRQNQKDGFLQVDERIGQLQQPENNDASAPPVTPTTDSNGTIIIPPITGESPNNAEAETAATPTNTTEPANKLDKNDPRGFYSYGTGKVDDKNLINKTAENPAIPEPGATPAPETSDDTAATATEDTQPTAENPPSASDDDAADANTETTPASDNTTDATDERSVYDHAFQTLLQDPKESIREFRAFLKEYPESKLAPSAQYWIGEALYAERDFKGAVQEFLIVLKDYKDSSKAPDAALKLGYSFYELKDWEKSRKTLEDVISFFPENAETVKLAQERLDKLSAEGH